MNKVLFAGTIEISKDILDTLLNIEDIKVVGVLTQTDKPVGRKKEIIFNKVKQFALEKKIKIIQPNKVIEVYDEIKELNPDFLVTCAYGKIIPQSILDLFKDCINVHASILPEYRGGSPLQKAIADGKKTTGITLMRMVKQMDAGCIFKTKEFDIQEEDNIESVFKKASIVGCELVKKYLIEIFKGKLIGEEQDGSKTTYAYNLKNEEEVVDFSKSAREVFNFVRSLTPWPIPYSFIENSRVKIGKVELENSNNYKQTKIPGTIVDLDKRGIIVECANNTFIRILQIQREGKKMVDANNFYNNPAIFAIGNVFKLKI